MTIAKLTLTLAICSLLLLLMGTAGARLQAFDHQIGLFMFSLAGLFSFISICTSALFTRRAKHVEARRKLSNAALIALPAIIFFSLSLFQGAGAPLIHDVSTDLRTPPEFIQAHNLRKPSDNSLHYPLANIPLQQQAYPELNTLNSPLSVPDAQKRATKIASEMGWLVYYQNDGHLEAEARSFWFGFIDDIVIRITPTATGSAIDLRSTSRTGKGDLGANAKRIKQFLNAFKIQRRS
ncbi:uncharacterized protein (DUF1499 family) [Zhongshania antarctica]|uniref:Uncharacterized protein (DUF1499 family) n=1 Tax=Zhongshania antarctica TaxID=641702 RepID=A0A840R498_9GAMM|nr:DUF1499 domain-containing protein [Zhongshania antarctica]MBB5187252.1 uncharacterized protein (DUF1499 family) [Zhongshania antarctica]